MIPATAERESWQVETLKTSGELWDPISYAQSRYHIDAYRSPGIVNRCGCSTSEKCAPEARTAMADGLPRRPALGGSSRTLQFTISISGEIIAGIRFKAIDIDENWIKWVG